MIHERHRHKQVPVVLEVECVAELYFEAAELAAAAVDLCGEAVVVVVVAVVAAAVRRLFHTMF
jgi:hypothetical protein